MSPNIVRICKACRYCDKSRQLWRCGSPENMYTDLVTGENKIREASCSAQRKPSHRLQPDFCGFEGSWWESAIQ